MSYKNILLESTEGVLTITLNRPAQMNALNGEIIEELRQAFAEAERDEQVKCVVITGSEKFFCAGADISEANQAASSFGGFAFSRRYQSFFLELERFKKPTVAAIRGYVLGGGLEFALACDFRIVAEDARLGVPEINIGALPAGTGTIKLPRLLGPAKAKEMLMLGEPISGKEAVALGLANKAVPADQVVPEAKVLGAKLAEKAPLPLTMMKNIIRETAHLDMSAAIEIEAQALGMLASTHDFTEGTKAFLEKRKPQFLGR